MNQETKSLREYLIEELSKFEIFEAVEIYSRTNSVELLRPGQWTIKAKELIEPILKAKNLCYSYNPDYIITIHTTKN